MDFAESLSYLLSLGHETLALKLGLRNTELLLERLGNPHKTFESVQIAGTNGKGSTAATLHSICRVAGISTGLYTSPHLMSITERIKINGQEITQSGFARHATTVREAAAELLAEKRIEALPTFFEHVTAIAFNAFREAEVELAILETGMGGRLDATTVAGAKTVGITPISLDHQEHLGETLEEIAFEKAAIIRPGVTAIVAPQSPAALAVLRKRSNECLVELSVDESQSHEVGVHPGGALEVTFETDQDTYENVQLPLRGRHQIVNTSLAIRLAESLRARGFDIPKAAIVHGVHATRHFGRMSCFDLAGSLMLVDGAHNPAAARALRDYLDEFITQPITLLFGGMRDKPLAEMAAILFPGVHRLVLTEPTNPRAASVESLQTLAKDFVPAETIITAPRVSDALQQARDATSPAGIICVTGSLYLVGEVLDELDLIRQSQV